MHSGKNWIGGIEAGGSKFHCAVASSPESIVAQTTIDTSTPEDTLARVTAFFRRFSEAKDGLSALGIASFGPIELSKASPQYGHILGTPKPAWRGVDIAGELERELNVPIGLDTDVNGAALAEQQFGAGRNCSNFAYVTVGTGIGAGCIVDGKILYGRSHPEVGHMLIPHDLAKDPFAGCCPFHGDCLEGLASGVAIEQRWGVPAAELADDSPAWNLVAEYLATMCVNMERLYASQRILIGGGVMQRTLLYGLVRQEFLRLMGGYRSVGADNIDSFIVAPALGMDAGLIGALLLAAEQRPAEKSTQTR